MDIISLLTKKRDGFAHTEDEIRALVAAITADTIPDYQVAAWLMAVYWRGMNATETAVLTAAMAESGERLDLKGIPGPVLDKHSTGGIGDKTTLVLAPLVAAAGVSVGKMSGRGLGFTGGTLDKLASFANLRLDLSPSEFKKQMETIGLAITGQSANLAPADRRLYALRDVTATVESVPLIAASVMSKKIAAGADAVVLDVKIGAGAFAKTLEIGTELAQMMIDIARHNDLRAAAVLTDMSQPLGRAVGNALEVREALATLRGAGPADLRELCLRLGAEMLVLAGRTEDTDRGYQELERLLAAGSALDKLAAMVSAQGGDVRAVYEPWRLVSATHQLAVASPQSGFVQRVDALAVARVVNELGGGRQSKDDVIDLSVGLAEIRKRGEYVQAGETLAVIHAADADAAEKMAVRVASAFSLADKEPESSDLILSRLS